MDRSRLNPDSAAKARGDQRSSIDRPVRSEKAKSEQERATGGKFVPSTPLGQNRNPRKLILCFDGTGNKFHGDESDSNILKIFRMLDRESDDQYHYYQPGIGTYVVSGSLSHTGTRARINSWYQKAKDSAVGSSFDQHVVGGYRFLMRFYNPGDEIYMFGFSRGAYVARFLAEMLDYVGLLSHGNEEMVKFAWKAFAQWQSRGEPSGSDKEREAAHNKKEQMYNFMKGFRETFSRPVNRIRFIGLFDTVNSVPRFEAAWMQRSRIPYTARSSAKVIRHAVSIDERRAKFRQDLMYQANPKTKHHRHAHLGEFFDTIEPTQYFHHHQHQGHHGLQNGHQNGGMANGVKDDEDQELKGEDDHIKERKPRTSLNVPSDLDDRSRGSVKYGPYRSRSKSRQRPASRDGCDGSDTASNMSVLPPSEIDANWDDEGQDIDEVWFAGGHGDVGGGWETLPDRKMASHIPLTWMVREAMKAGCPFDVEKVQEMGCYFDPKSGKSNTGGKQPRDHVDIPKLQVDDGGGDGPRSPEINSPSSPDLSAKDHPTEFHAMMHKTHTSQIHDSLTIASGLGWMPVLAWNIMEHIPFRRMDLQADGSWEPIRWPLPRGEVRDIPDNVRVHGSVVRRMHLDKSYRPGNLIVGGGGRGLRKAPAEYGMGEWECVSEPGDPIGEVWIRKFKPGSFSPKSTGKKKKGKK